MNFFIGIVQEFWLHFRTAIFKNTFSPQNTSIRCFHRKQPLGAVLEKKRRSGVCFSLRRWGVQDALLKAQAHWHNYEFLAPKHLDSLEKEPVLVSAKLTWKNRLTKEHGQAAAFVHYNKVCISWYGRNMTEIKISINFCTSLISPLISRCTILRMKPRTQSGNP